MFKLYSTPISANGRKVLAVAYHLNLQPEVIEMNVYKGDGQSSDYLSINPFGKIPTLVDGDFVLWESNAIMQYITEKYGDYKLSSKNLEKRADIARWLFWESSHWQPAISKVAAEAVGHKLIPNIVPEPKNEPNWSDEQIAPLAQYLESHLGSSQFLVGEELTIADYSVAGMMTYSRFAKFPFEQFVNISAWYESIERLDAWKRTETQLWTIETY